MANPHPVSKPHPRELKLQAAAELYLTGSSKKASDNLGGVVTDRCIRKWKQNDPDFQNHFMQIAEDDEQESLVKYRRIIAKGLKVQEDRLDNGNVKVIPTGEVLEDDEGNKVPETIQYREPVTLKDATVATGVMIDKNRVAMNLPSRITGGKDNASDMMDAFRKICDQFQEKQANVVSTQELPSSEG
jgi:hypothetical protein